MAIFKSVPFSKYTVASTAYMFTFSDNIDIGLLFNLLYITANQEEIGLIGAKCQNMSRGIVKDSKCMKNTILINMIDYKDDNSLIGKISIKINLNKIHICGTKSLNSAKRVAQTVLNHINEVHEFLRRIKKLESLDSKLDLFIDSINKTKYIFKDPLINKYILNQYQNYKYMVYGTNDIQLFKKQILFYQDLTDIPEDHNIISEHTNMLNYNYCLLNNIESENPYIYLPMRVDIVRHISEDPHFKIDYDNRIRQNIVLIYQKTDIQKFIIYRNGKITHSGNDSILMEEAYDYLMNLLSTIKLQKRAVSHDYVVNIPVKKLEDIIRWIR